MKKVLFVLGTLSRGGAERVATKLCNHLVNNGYEVYIACLLSSKIEYDVDYKVQIFDITEHKRNIFSLFRWIKNLRNIIKDINPDSIIACGGRVSIVALLAGKKSTVTACEINDPRYDNRGFFSLSLCKFLYRHKAKNIVFQTFEVQNLFSKSIINKSLVIHNPISCPTKTKDTYDDNKRIIMLGRLVWQKNYELAIRAFAIIAKKYPDTILDIYGVGLLESELNELISSLDLIGRVNLKGLTYQPEEELVTSSIYLLSSRYEGLSNSLMEALSVGVPCISTPIAGSNEIVKNNENGFLLEDFSVDNLSEKLELLLDNKSLREKFGKNGISSMKENYEELIFKKWVKLIDD